VSEEEPTARITLTKVYEELRELKDTVGTLVVLLPAHTQATDDKLAEHQKKLADQEIRIRTLETRNWQMVGAFGSLAVIAPFLSRIFIP
jgi:hypothetical protein